MIIEYKQFRAQVNFSANTRSYYGEIIGVTATVVFLATDRSAIETAMHQAVDQFLVQTEDCVLS